MRRFRFVWLLCGLLVVLGLVPALWLIFGNGSHSVTRDNFEKIRIGMTREEVDGILDSENAHVVMGGPFVTFPVIYSEDDGSRLVPGDWIQVDYGLVESNFAWGKTWVVGKDFHKASLTDVWQRIKTRTGW
jgi:hypothetical protein